MTSDDDEDLSGFEEFIEEFEPEIQEKKKKGKNKFNSEINSYIDDEKKRLSKLSEFFHSKMKNADQYQQSSDLISKQKSFNRVCRERLNKRFQEEDSDFQKNLKQLFENHFKELN